MNLSKKYYSEGIKENNKKIKSILSYTVADYFYLLFDILYVSLIVIFLAVLVVLILFNNGYLQ